MNLKIRRNANAHCMQRRAVGQVIMPALFVSSEQK